MSGVAFVTGGFGFLGQRLVVQLLSKGWRVGVIDPGAPGDGVLAFGGLAGTIVAARSRVSHDAWGGLVQALGAPQRVFHLAGSASVGAAEGDPELDREITVESTRVVLDALVPHPTARLVLVSSAAVYGDAGAIRLRESAPRAPMSAYGRHKAEAEDLVSTSGRSSAIVRFFSLYGPGLRKQLLWDACHKLSAGEATFAGLGSELRDWVHVDDAVSLLEHVASAKERVLLVNGGTGIGTSVSGVLQILNAGLVSAGMPKFTGIARAGDPRALVAEPTRAFALGWLPKTTVAQGLVEYARWFESQRC